MIITAVLNNNPFISEQVEAGGGSQSRVEVLKRAGITFLPPSKYPRENFPRSFGTSCNLWDGYFVI